MSDEPNELNEQLKDLLVIYSATDIEVAAKDAEAGKDAPEDIKRLTSQFTSDEIVEELAAIAAEEDAADHDDGDPPAA